MAKDKINEATTVASSRSRLGKEQDNSKLKAGAPSQHGTARPRVEGWALTVTWRYPDGTWNTETITDFPEHLGITINEWLQDYEKD